jgi:hypothetical protein
MRLNAGKCKVMHFKAKSPPPHPVSLAQTALEVVPCYKYLGVDINSTLDSKMQWNRVNSLISPNIYLLKQLKSCGLNEPILVNVFKSLVLSHFRYSSTVLVSCPDNIKSDMQVIQNKMLRIIGTSREVAKAKYNIQDVSSFIESESIAQVTRILNTPTHSLTTSLKGTIDRRTNSPFPFTIPLSHSDKFNNNAVMITLRHLRDNVYGTGRSKSKPPSAHQPQLTTVLTAPNDGRVCTNKQCPKPTQKWLRPDIHERSCFSKFPSII